jgi:hypothetical protein
MLFLTRVSKTMSNLPASFATATIDPNFLCGNYKNITISGETGALGGLVRRAPNIYFSISNDQPTDPSLTKLNDLSQNINTQCIKHLEDLLTADPKVTYAMRLDKQYGHNSDGQQIEVLRLSVKPDSAEYDQFAENMCTAFAADKNNDIDPDGAFNLLALDKTTIELIKQATKDLVSKGKFSESRNQLLQYSAHLKKKEDRWRRKGWDD